uniref:t-SNARE coiled-coil homology domain-containing protein n=1 Tax=Heterorhabditis bacteriophora TaxID=37862 RepID=A0A1I7X7B5_HETBA
MMTIQISRGENFSEKKLRENVLSALVFSLSQLANDFRSRQSKYLSGIKVLSVNSSILELNTLFKDLSTMVIDQDSLLDRIDYNVEQASIRVTKAAESVKKAENYQRGDKKMHFESQHYGGMLSVLDDGCGLDRSEAISVVSFGHSLKRMEPGMVGQYGNGLKSGAMRIAKDFILFTKKDGLLTCLLLSRTFHEKYGLKEVFVPAPSFTIDGGHRAMYCDSQQTLAKHGKEMEIIYDHTPFNSQDKLFEQFSRISGPNGTLIVLFHLRRIETGDFELDFKTDPFDMKLSNFEEQREEERNSLRAYLSVLYINPRMKVYLRGKKVLTNRILSNLLYPYKYNYAAKNLKTCAAKELEKCEKKVQEVNDLLALARSSRGEFEAKYRGMNIMIDKSLRTEQRMLQRFDQTLDFFDVFFFNTKVYRNRYGCMIYNNGRLIELYVKTAVQKEKNDLMMKPFGYDNSQWSSVCTNGVLERQTRFVKTGHTVQCTMGRPPMKRAAATRKVLSESEDEVEEPIERAERGDKALLQIKRLINFFIKQGCTFAEKLKRAGDDAILEVDMEQFGRNLWEEKVLKPLREKDEARLRDKVEQRRIADQELKKEILAIMKWANSSINGVG